MFRDFVERSLGRNDEDGSSDESGAADRDARDEPPVPIQTLDVVRIVGPEETSIAFLEPGHDPATESGGWWLAAADEDVENLEDVR